MPIFIDAPSEIAAAGTHPKLIREFFGRVRSGTDALSIAQMESPSGWNEPGQRPEFDEYTVVLRGTLRLTFEQSHLNVGVGQAVLVQAGEWVQYSTPGPEGASYLAICRPAFSPDRVHRDEG